MGDNGDIREDLRVPENDIGREIESKFEAGDDFLVSRGFSEMFLQFWVFEFVLRKLFQTMWSVSWPPDPVRRSLSLLPWGRSVPSVPRPWQTNKGDGLLATGTTHNRPLAFSLALSPKRQPSQPTSIILLWFLSWLSFLPLFFISVSCQEGFLGLTAEVLFDDLLYIKRLKKINDQLLVFALLVLPLTSPNVSVTGFSFYMIIFIFLKIV